jgi:hypothetical protein
MSARSFVDSLPTMLPTWPLTVSSETPRLSLTILLTLNDSLVGLAVALYGGTDLSWIAALPTAPPAPLISIPEQGKWLRGLWVDTSALHNTASTF